MKAEKKEMIVLYIKNKEMNWAPITKQTKSLRDKTNEKIRLLGKKYYIIKEIFDKLNFKRDDIFIIGKELEDEYKDVKQNIHLQNQTRRMKEALYCWYAEHFFNEISIPNSVFLNNLILKSNRISKKKPISKTKTRIKEQKNAFTKQIKPPIAKEKENIEPSLIINQEIDSFAFSNISKEIRNDESIHALEENLNFNFDTFLNF